MSQDGVDAGLFLGGDRFDGGLNDNADRRRLRYQCRYVSVQTTRSFGFLLDVSTAVVTPDAPNALRSPTGMERDEEDMRPITTQKERLRASHWLDP